MKRVLSIILVMIMICVSMFSGVVFAEGENVFSSVEVEEIIRQTNIESLQASSAILIEANTGQILFEKNIDEKFPIASLTKIMSLYLVFEALANGDVTYDTIVTASEYAVSFGGSQVYLAQGEQFRLEDMINAIDIHSANDATVAVAENIAGSENAFVHKMNEKAAELGMVNTNFIDCTGLTDEGHYSTAGDIAILSAALITTYPDILNFSTKWYEVFRPGDHQIDLYNRNKLIKYYDGADGLKTGFTTAAGYCLAATAKRDDFRVVTVVFGEPNTNSRFAEASKLLDHGFLNFEFITIEDKDQIVGEIEIEKGLETKMNCYVSDNSEFLLDKNKVEDIERVVDIPETLEAPVEKDSVIGSVTYMLDGEELGSVDVLLSASTEKASFFQLLWRSIKEWLGIE